MPIKQNFAINMLQFYCRYLLKRLSSKNYQILHLNVKIPFI
ncbi:hypothetical protein FDUTEX481_05841 [Tolypothrix sp. PCC 7601]|nr:hypothetical protein FDUTEX481_05841 [Tolypothrix sp. PCC 7601]